MKRVLLLITIVAALFGSFASNAFAVEEAEGGGSETIKCLYSYSYQSGNYDVHIYRFYFATSGTWGGECRREYSTHDFNT